MGSGSVALGSLARTNTRRQKVEGSDMAKYWDSGDRAHVLKRNRVDCELTARLYFQFLEEGYINTGGASGHFSVEPEDVETILIASGLMCQYSADEYSWRMKHHNGVRGARRFNGLPWTARPDYDVNRQSLFLIGVCPECRRQTLFCTPNDEQTNTWLATIRCDNCGSCFEPPSPGRLVGPKDLEFPELVRRHLARNAVLEKRRGFHERPQPLPEHFEIFPSSGSFRSIDQGYTFDNVPVSVPRRKRMEKHESDLQLELKSAPFMRNRYARWHPDWDYWQSKL